MVRTTCCEKTGLKRGAWTPEEDTKLSSYIMKYGHWNWRELPKYAGLQRCGKSCRLRWVNYLKPDIKRGGYTKEEEEIIINLHRALGNRWSAIAAKLPGRTDNEIKNYWHTHLKKRSKPDSMLSEEKKSQNQRETSKKNKTEAAHNHHQSIINTTCFSSDDDCIAAKPTVLESSSVASLSSSTTPTTPDTKMSCDVISLLKKTDSSDDDLIKSNKREMDGNFNYFSSEINLAEVSGNGSFWTEPFVVAQDFTSSTLCNQQYLSGVSEQESSISSYDLLCSDDSMDFWFNSLSLEGEMQGIWVQPWASGSQMQEQCYEGIF